MAAEASAPVVTGELSWWIAKVDEVEWPKGMEGTAVAATVEVLGDSKTTAVVTRARLCVGGLAAEPDPYTTSWEPLLEPPPPGVSRDAAR